MATPATSLQNPLNCINRIIDRDLRDKFTPSPIYDIWTFFPLNAPPPSKNSCGVDTWKFTTSNRFECEIKKWRRVTVSKLAIKNVNGWKCSFSHRFDRPICQRFGYVLQLLVVHVRRIRWACVNLSGSHDKRKMNAVMTKRPPVSCTRNPCTN